MPPLQPHTFTRLLLEWRNGDPLAQEELLRLAYKKLYDRAKWYMRRERQGHLLQATALINEVYLKLVRADQLNCESRNDFFAVCAKLMRDILVDMAKSTNAKGRLRNVSLDEALVVPQGQPIEIEDMVALDQALKTLAELNPRQSQVAELRYFGGLKIEEVASVLQVSHETVKRDWRLARVWLLHELSRKESDVA